MIHPATNWYRTKSCLRHIGSLITPQTAMGHYRDLKAWQVTHELALEVSRVVDVFPKHERFELTSQLRRASLSVPTNLAEGQARYGPREALRFARIAAGSLAEVDYLLFFAN